MGDFSDKVENRRSQNDGGENVSDINDRKSIEDVTAEVTEHRARFATKSKAEFDAMPYTDKLKAAEHREII